MTLIELLLLLVIAAICGGLGQSLVGYSTGGCLVSIFLGIVGAYLGTWIARELGLPILLPITIGGNSFPIIWAVIGSAIAAAIAGFINKSLQTRRRR
ncbi:MAG: hypothetical protein VKL39_02440 [Leptolyngbyaceae bacterium]|nr:hypothetical protein [Leptolyngbyaceae bacterium]